MKKGFTLIESVVVIAILAILALASINTIVEFQKNAILTAATQELASTLRVAQANSTAGKLQPGETADTYVGTNIPNYNIHMSGNTYQLVRMYPDRTMVSELPLEKHTIDSSLSLFTTPHGISDVMFNRVTGATNAITLTLSRSNGETRSITITKDVLISL